MQNGVVNINDFFSYYKETAWEQNTAGMINLYSDDVIIFDMWDNEVLYDLKAWASVITKWLTSLKDEKVKVVFEKIEISEGENLAFATALIQFQAISIDNTVVRSMKNRISLGFVKTEGFWKVKHQHTSVPIDSNLKAIFDI